ncbi:App1 family protein [Cellulomonas cellasea]|uniref:Phosphatidate phosphatase APP1 catalytic domain-containing protein n=2 Tax=Cellulomonas cellasea TaxID=43670 RepID=A0A0A0B8P9_9CELL|nr:phosphatase domain-containing protein [Cellulomonas cellasea]KGM02512.1 hypothetical protein Q760_13080 [Cellulomonas cellasea DSM 20118]GEA88714.1 hypothetical protein CCE01nite_26630 [Cellulomonas cellasea]
MTHHARPAATTTQRPHRAARYEDALNRRVARWLSGRGWTARIEPYVGYGSSAGWVRVLARVLLASPAVPDADLPGAGTVTSERDARDVGAVRGWRSFATAQVPEARVEIEVSGRTFTAVADRGGYVDAVVEAELAPGWHDVTVRAPGGASQSVPVLVIDPATPYGLVSDIDDTIMVTRLPRPLIAAWNSFVRHENAREPVPGMASLYRALLTDRPDMPVIYLSTGAWNAAPTLGRFIRRHEYPVGPLMLTDWGPTNTGWFRSGQEHKNQTLRRLVQDFPEMRWVLVGDDGQHDPEIYASLVRERPDRVRAVVIRQLTGAEHVLAHGAPTSTDQASRAEGRTQAEGVPVVQGADGKAILQEWRSRGVTLT